MQTNALRNGSIIDSAVIALLISSQFLNYTLQKYGVTGILTPLIIGDGCLLLISTIIYRKGRLFINQPFIFLTAIISAFYAGSLLIPNKSTIAPVEFIAFCIIPLFIGAIAHPDYEQALKMIMWMLCFAVPAFSSFFAKANHSGRYDSMTLSTSYAVIPVIMAGIVHFLYYRHKQKLWTKILYCVSFLFLAFFIPNSYRGPFVTVFITLIIIWISKGELRKSPRKLLLAIALIVLLVVVYYNLIRILYLLQSVFSRFGISVATIEKTLILSGDVFDGRTDLYASTVKLILESPIVGHGVSMYAHYVPGVDYPHNFILQLLFDGGIILFLSFFLSVAPCYSRVLRNKDYQPKGKVAVVLLLSGTEITRALLSGNIWRILQFWLLIGIVMNNNDRILNEQRKEDRKVK